MTARETALLVIRDVFSAQRDGRGAQESLDYRARRANLDARDRAFATELAYGAIKMRRTLDWYLDPFLSERPKPLPAATHEILRLGVYELAYTRADVHATVSEFVDLAKRYGHRGLANVVNAVLRSFLRERPLDPHPGLFGSDDDYVATRYSLPTWLVKQWSNVFGEARVEEICGAVNAPARLALTVDRRHIEPEVLAEQLRGEGIEAVPSAYVRESLVIESGASRIHERAPSGISWMQSESSAIAVEVLQPQAHERILDLCSGRGNKALQIGSRLAGEGELWCVERDERRVAVLQERLAAHGISATVIAGDAKEAPGKERGFDRVLVDAPCSGVGVVGRHPEARWKKQNGDGERLAVTQRALIEAAAQRLFPGGVLVYAVCSTDPRESTEVIEEFLRRQNFIRGLIPATLEPFITPAGDVLIPPGIDGRDGFYVARLEHRL